MQDSVTKFFAAIVIMMISLLYSINAFAGDATLTWNAPTTKVDGTPLTDLAGYKVYYGTSSGNYSKSIDVGIQTTYTVTGLGTGTYYFAATAYDSSGNESSFSSEASKTFSGIQSTDPSGSSSNASGGCGMVFPRDGKPPGPGQAADMLILIAVMVMLLIKRKVQSLKFQVLHHLCLLIKELFAKIVCLEGQQMFKYRISNYIIVLAALVVLLASGQALAANYPLEIIQPRAGLDTKNRFYKAYPGLEYNVRMAVIGGAYPFTYFLTTAPSGMTINSSTGVIIWPNPTTTGSPYTVTASVKDQGNTTVSVTWTITVTTSGFIFVDAVNGHASTCNGGSATGTISSPVQTMADWYCGNTSGAKHDATYANYFIYYRTGTYYLTGFIEPDDAGRMPMTLYEKPMVWLAYPGEFPVVDLQNGNASPIWYGGNDNLYIDGFEIRNGTNMLLQTTGGGSNQTFRRNYFHDLHVTRSGFNNQSMIRLLSEGGNGLYMTIADNVMSSFSHSDSGNGVAVIKFYDAWKALVEDNTISNSTGTNIEGVAMKGGMTRPTVRHNTIHDICCNAIGGNTHSNYDTEILYNNLKNADIILNQDDLAYTFYIYRNTVVGGVIVLNADSTTGPFTFTNNVIVNNSANTDHINCGGGVVGCTDPSKVIRIGNLSGISSDNIVDANGNLTTAYLSYLGLKGYQINGNLPAPPKNLVVK